MKNKNLVVIQLSGGNDYLNTIVPYESGLYYDYRPNMGLKDDSIIPVDNKVAFNSNMDVFKKSFDEKNLAVMMGIGYPEPNRSHFRSMDIWHTAEPFESSSIGWLGKTVKNLDPESKNPVTAVSFGKGLPRALACPGVSVASVGALESYGLFTGVSGSKNREILLEELPKAGFTTFSPPDGAFYIYVDISKFSNDSLSFCKRVLDEAGVAITPGLDFDQKVTANFEPDR